MASTRVKLLDRSKDFARQQILASVKTRYFPELWYILESWFLTIKPKRALAVGDGFGLVADALARSGWDLTIVDPSAEGLAAAKERLEKAGLSASYEQAEPDALPFASGTFAAVVSLNTLELAQNSYKAAHELARVLAPSGRAVIATFNKTSPWGIPGVISAIRPDDDRRSARFLSKAELNHVLKATKLSVAEIKRRATYLPMGGKVLSLKIPIPGAFVALLSKPESGSAEGGSADGDTPKTRRRPRRKTSVKPD